MVTVEDGDSTQPAWAVNEGSWAEEWQPNSSGQWRGHWKQDGQWHGDKWSSKWGGKWADSWGNDASDDWDWDDLPKGDSELEEMVAKGELKRLLGQTWPV